MYQWAVHCMNGSNKQAFDIGHISPVKYFFAVAFILGVLFAFISQGDQPDRLFILTFVQWQLQTGIPIALLIMCHMMLSRSKSFEKLNPWWQLLLSGLLGVIIFTPIALMLDYFFAQNVFDQKQWLNQFFDELMGVGPPVVISWMAMNAPWVLGYRIKQQPPEKMAEEPINQQNLSVDGDSVAPFVQLLPVAIGTEVVYLKAELHYIEVNTPMGQALILYNLKDAMAEMPAHSGMHCHRSYWVNSVHVIGFKKQGRQGVLLLSNNTTVPVSRNRLSAVIEACTQAGKSLN